MTETVKRLASVLCMAVLSVALGACVQVSAYVDAKLGDTSYATLKTPPQPQPIQLAFDFQNKGESNPGAVSEIKPQIAALLLQSGLFSTVSDTPVPSGRKLTIVIDRVRLSNDKEKTAFGVGMSTGGNRTMLTDGYTCTTVYSEPGHAARSTQVRHALYRTSDYSGPDGLTAMTRKQANDTVYRQMISRSLVQLDRDSDLGE
jgi:hypothetical protein